MTAGRRVVLVVCLALMLAGRARAQVGPDHWTPPLASPAARHAADVASWATVLAAVALDSAASWRARDRSRALELQAARVGVVYGAAFLVKALVRRQRPCAPACGSDDPDYSFFSAHTALAFSTVGGARVAFTIPLAVTTGGLRVAAGKHWLTDVLAGAGVGWLASRIR